MLPENISRLPLPDQLAWVRERLGELDAIERDLRNQLVDDPTQLTGLDYDAAVSEVDTHMANKALARETLPAETFAAIFRPCKFWTVRLKPHNPAVPVPQRTAPHKAPAKSPETGPTCASLSGQS